jgi:hypothetical protein
MEKSAVAMLRELEVQRLDTTLSAVLKIPNCSHLKKEAKPQRTEISPVSFFTGYLPACSWARPSCAEAVAAVHGAIATRQERYSSVLATVCADCRMHLAWTLSKSAALSSTATLCSS